MTDGRPIPRAATILLVAVTVLVVFMLLPNNRSSIMVKEFCYFLGGCLAAVLLAVAALRRTSAAGVPPLAAAAWTALVAWMLVMHHAGIRSVNGPGYLMSFASLGVLAACAAALTDARGRRTVLWVLSGATVLVCAYSLLQYFNVRVFPWDVYLNTTGRVSGSLGNPNLLGGFLAAMLPVTAGLVLSTGSRPRVKALLIALAAVMTILTISASGTRSSLIGLTAGALLMGLLGLKGSRTRVAVLAGVAVLLLTAVLMRDRISELASSGRGTMQVRLVIWEGAARMIGDAPLTGFGPGSFQMVFPRYRDPEYNLLGVSHNTLHAHNEYLEILTDTGLVGLALFSLLAFALLRGMRRTSGWGGFSDPSVAGTAAGMFAMLCEASVSVALRWPPSAYLLALLTGLLAGAVPAAPPRPMRRIVAVPLLAAAVLGLAIGIPHYLRFLRSGYLLFIGKDLTLDTIEQELSLAYGAATAWEQTGDQTRRMEALRRYDHADVLCDSAIELCSRCVTVNPDELGGYYGLGSAWLTRAIIIEPPNPPLSRLLDSDGRVRSRDSALAATRMALTAYQTLASRAPDYAELHNNLALTYTRLGQPAMTIRSMRRAYELYAHRRWNYLRQAFELAPLGGAWDALHINMSAIYSELAEWEPGDPKQEGRLTNALWFSGFAMVFEPSAADSLLEALTELAGQVPGPAGSLVRSTLQAQAGSAAVDSALLADAAAGIPVEVPELGAVLPGRLYAAAASAAAEGDLEGYAGINRFMMYLYHAGFIWMHEWPRHGGLSPALASAYPAAGPPELWRPVFLESAKYLMMMDEYVSGRVRIARTDFAGGVDPAVLEGLEEVWEGVGGPRAALDAGAGGLWLPGSSLAAMAAAADSAALSGAEGVETRLALHYMLVGMTWWTDGSLDEDMRLEVIATIASDRAALDSLLGPGEAPYAVSRLLDGVEPLLDGCIWEEHRPFLAAIRQEIVGGALTGIL